MVLKTTADANRENVLLEMQEDGKPLAHMLLDGASAEGLIHQIGHWRSQLEDEVSPALDPKSLLHAIVDPGWMIDGAKHEGRRLLAMRHPGLGWIAFLIPDGEATKMAEWLSKDLPESPK
ncbi:hypothetical protein ACQR2B_06445 [Bradyrhizobium oligotrophicum]|uniref:hypothetical protein n=1 Tax=Bradyrhizobium TaxID=374 RepID=UPI003EBC9D82